MATIADTLYQSSPIWLQNSLVSAYGYWLYQKRYTGLYKDIRKAIETMKSMPAEQIEAFQAEKLHHMIKYCRQEIPYYQVLLSDLGLTEQDFTATRHLAKLPVLDKQTVQEQSHLFRSPSVQPHMVQHTSGSTGTPLVLNVDEYTYKLAMALVVDHEEGHGIPFGARRATFAGRLIQPVDNTSAPFSRYNRAENQRLFSSYHINEATFPHYRRELDEFSPVELIGYPSAIYDLACQYERASVQPDFQPKAVVTNSETLMDWQRPMIEHVFKCPVRDYYGTAEYVLFAAQCRESTYHINPLIGLVETIGENGSGVTEIPGEILASTLTNKAMPLLRYKTGDTAILGSNSCSCGSHFLNFRQALGRTDDVIKTLDGKSIGRIDHIFKGLNGIKEAQVVQNQLDQCTIKVVKSNGAESINEEALIANLLTRTGQDMKVQIEYVTCIERGANGKFKGVINYLL